jgi:hypothetical protein
MPSKSRSDARQTSASSTSPSADQEYKVGPGRPPKEYQFKPGQSGNPQGKKRKPQSVAIDLKAALESALNKTVTMKQGDRERTVTMARAGIEQLVAQYAKGDRHARRDLMSLADKLGVNLVVNQQALRDALAASHEEILLAYVERQYDKVVFPRVFAPSELMDDGFPKEKHG